MDSPLCFPVSPVVIAFRGDLSVSGKAVETLTAEYAGSIPLA